jgi:hypothetical protein
LTSHGSHYAVCGGGAYVYLPAPCRQVDGATR